MTGLQGVSLWVTKVVMSDKGWADERAKAAVVRKFIVGRADGECWVLGSEDTYPDFAVKGYPRHALHRAVYQTLHGTLDDNLVVRHTCDRKQCINPDHLIKGTPVDNVEDAYERGRIRKNHAKGEQCASAVLTDDLVVQIRRRARSGESYYSIAADVGASYASVRRAAIGVQWSHVSEPPVAFTPRGETTNPRLLARIALKPQVLKMWQEGKSFRAIEEETGVNRSTTCRWTRGARRREVRQESESA